MLKAGRKLQDWGGSFIHVTCLCHLLHRVAEFIQSEFGKANLLIRQVSSKFILRLYVCHRIVLTSSGKPLIFSYSAMKKVFHGNSIERVATFNRLAPNAKLPPRVVPTRWGESVNQFDQSNTQSISHNSDL